MPDLRPAAGDDRRTQWTSRIAWALCGLAGAWTVCLLVAGSAAAAGLAVLSGLGFGAVPRLIDRGHRTGARWLLIGLANGATAALAVGLGRGAGVEAGFYVLTGLPLLTMGRAQRQLWAGVLLPAALASLLHLWILPMHPDAAAPAWLQVAVAASIFTVAYLLVRSLYGVMAETEDLYEQIADTTIDKDRDRDRANLGQDQQAKMILASKMSALGEMAGGVAHEINNPLAIILGRAMKLRQILADEVPDQEQARALVANIESTADRIGRIVRGLRSFSRTADNDPFELAPLATIVDDTLALCAERLRHAGIGLRIGSVPTDLVIECRPTEISQVLLNLIGNAFDAVEGTAVGERWIDLACTDLGDQVQLAISDSGPGIPPALLEKIFLPFFTTKPVGRGTGLGLSVSKGIVEVHHGVLRFDPDGPPTRFIVELKKRRTTQGHWETLGQSEAASAGAARPRSSNSRQPWEAGEQPLP